MTPHGLLGLVSPYFRRRRLAQFLRLMGVTSETTILDVGGFPGFWDSLPAGIRPQITVINPDVTPGIVNGIRCMAGSGLLLPFTNQSFDIAFSNSTIEHLGQSRHCQREFACEMMRVGRRVWCQTPARCFPVEPHFLTPFVHWFPLELRKCLVRNFTVWGWMTRASVRRCRAMANEIRLLNAADVESYFPHLRIMRERCLGLVKSYVAHG